MVVPSQWPHSGWHATSAGQNWSPVPQKPNCEQHCPNVEPRHVLPPPQDPSVVTETPGGRDTGAGGAAAAEVLLGLGAALDAGVVGAGVVATAVVLRVLEGGAAAGRLEDGAGAGAAAAPPKHIPNLDWQPVPQKSMPSPQ